MVSVRLRSWAITLFSTLASVAQAGPLISEIYFNPPGGNDAPSNNALEYIELCAPIGTSLTNTYLIFLENENDEFNSGNPGEIENIFDLNDMSFGSNGYLTLAMRNSAYPTLANTLWQVAAPVNPADPTKAESLKVLANGGHVYQNRDTGNGYGNGATSSIGHVGQSSDIEGSGFTAMLIHVDPLLGGVAPLLNQDLDIDNLGLDPLPSGWTILDSIGVFGEADEPPFGRIYSTVGFGPGATVDSLGGVGADYIDTLIGLGEIEYIGRIGTGNTSADWMAANLTDNALTGYSSALRNYAISGNHALMGDPEVYVGGVLGASPFAYGTDITVTFSADNVGFTGSHIPEVNSGLLILVGASAGYVARRYVRRNRK